MCAVNINLTDLGITALPSQPCHIRKHQCPICGSKTGFSIKAPEGYFNCFKCKVKGRLGGGMQVYRADEARKAQSDDYRRRVERWRRNTKRLVPINETVGMKYLTEERKLSRKIVLDCGIRFSASWQSLNRSAVVFPLRDTNDATRGFQGRYLDNCEPRMTTLNAPNVKEAGVFLTAGAKRAKRVALVEAPIDAMSFAMLYEIPAIAVIGTRNLPDWLVAHLKGRDVILASDNDAAGEMVAITWERQLGGGQRLRPTGKDWNGEL